MILMMWRTICAVRHQQMASGWWCKINTDEAFPVLAKSGWLTASALLRASEWRSDLSAIIIGMDPMNNEVIWEKCSKPSGDRAAAAFFRGDERHDIALWDIKGKAWGVLPYKCLAAKAARK
ncbi:hypothetical protein KCP69_03035 [Salmonella enterica subsp. enterica]|nr:hypothetical protein KCP69_03035 [Salmonella enterica subsp. enterica]